MGVSSNTDDYGEERCSMNGPESNECNEVGLLQFLKEMICQIAYSEQQVPIFQRVYWGFRENWPRAKQSAKNSTDNVLRWMHRGGPWRAFVVILVGMISLIALTGLGVFMLFFLAATTNTLLMSLLMSIAAFGGFLALFFTCLTVIYVVALSIAAFVISIATLVTISSVLVATGWIGFFWLVWQGIRKSVDITRGSFVMTASAVSAISANRPTSTN